MTIKKRKNSNYKIIIKKIEIARKNNNKNWMKLLAIALDSNPKDSSKVLKSINLNDIKISKLLSKIKIS